LLKVVKRTESGPLQATLNRILSVLIALLAAALVIKLLGYDPFIVYKEMIKGSLGSAYCLKETINKAIPLLVMGLGVAVCFKMKFSNIGTEGQFYMGALGATYVALNYSSLPAVILLPLMFIVAFIMGGIWCLIAALLKLRWNANETLVTLMMNYIAIKLVSYLQYGPWRDPKAYGFPKIANFPKNAWLPEVLGVHCGWIIATVLTVFIYILFSRSKLGYEISVMGESPLTAKYAGLDTTKIFLIAILLGGGLSGAAGMLQASGIERTLNDQLSGSLGFTAVIVAWMAQLSPIIIFIVSFFFAVLLQGGSYIQSALQIPSAAALILQGIILLFVLGSEFFTQYKIVYESDEDKGALSA